MTTTFEQLYTLKIPEVRKLFLEAMAQIVNRAVVEEMAKAIDENDLEALYEASGFTPAVLNGIITKINEVYEDTANITVGRKGFKHRSGEKYLFLTYETNVLKNS